MNDMTKKTIMAPVEKKDRFNGTRGNDTLQLADTDNALYLKVGSLIYRAATEPAFYEDFRSDPATTLDDAGVPRDGRQIYLVQDDPKLVHIVIPEVRSPDQVDNAYLTELGLVTLRACKR